MPNRRYKSKLKDLNEALNTGSRKKICVAVNLEKKFEIGPWITNRKSQIPRGTVDYLE